MCTTGIPLNTSVLAEVGRRAYSFIDKQRKDANDDRRAAEAQTASLTAAAQQQLSSISAGMRRPSALEPLKEASETISAAKADMQRKQLMRRGLMSTFTRYDKSGPASSAAGSTAGKSKTLGG